MLDRSESPKGFGANLEGGHGRRLTRADRAAFLVDADRYFAALHRALASARKQVLIAGWDLHSRTPLLPDEPDSTLTGVLEKALAAHPELRVHLLVWKPPWTMRLQREWFTRLRMKARLGGAVRFHRESAECFGQAHHQKIVVIDDGLAFVGGIDLTARRWDEPTHPPNSDHRTDPWGDAYEPWHDSQILVRGEAANALGEALRERWREATGEALDAPHEPEPEWPTDGVPTVHDAPVVIANTQVSDERDVRGVEALYRSVIARARRWIYLENQYFASELVVGWLEERLDEPDGPEIVVVTPATSDSWLDDVVMDSKRAHLLERIRKHPNAHRFGVFSPFLRGEEATPLFVHAKILAADLDYVSVGSSNLANRSFRLDSECDLGVVCGEAARQEGPPPVFALLAEHLGAEPEALARCVETQGSLLAAIEALRGKPRSLEPLRIDWNQITLGPEIAKSLDPETPTHPLRVLRSLFRDRPKWRRRMIGIGLVALGVLMGTILVVGRWAS